MIMYVRLNSTRPPNIYFAGTGGGYLRGVEEDLEADFWQSQNPQVALLMPWACYFCQTMCSFDHMLWQYVSGYHQVYHARVLTRIEQAFGRRPRRRNAGGACRHENGSCETRWLATICELFFFYFSICSPLISLVPWFRWVTVAHLCALTWVKKPVLEPVNISEFLAPTLIVKLLSLHSIP